MANEQAKKGNFSEHLSKSMKWGGLVVEDFFRSLIGFVPNGLNAIYDGVLKYLPVLGNLFAHRWIEQSLKLCLGITIGQGIATDVSHYLFRPIGQLFGLLFGLVSKNIPNYSGQFGRALYRMSGQAIGGILLGFGIIFLAMKIGLLPPPLITQYVFIAIALGGFFGILTKVIAVMSIRWVESANAATIRRNVSRARELNSKLKAAAKQYAKSKILMYAQDIILQMNGALSQQNLEIFFNSEYERFADNTYKKIDRHFDYLADRACHGDIKALRKLQALLPPKTNLQHSPFADMINRIFNERAIFKLKDDVDTYYDRWQYMELKQA